MIDIIPAILPKDFDELAESLEHIKGVAREVQIDVVDGAYAPNVTWPYSDPGSFERLTSEEEGLPHWEEFDFEFDVMAHNSAKDVEKYIQAGAARMLIHADAQGAGEAVEKLQKYREGELNILVGVALSTQLDASALSVFEGFVDYVQVMGIAKVGFQGQPFDEKALALISAVRTQYPDLAIQVDGSVNMRTVRPLVEAGATRLVAGSSIFAAEDPAAAYRALSKKANEH